MGNLFYAVAMADKSIHVKELETLKRLVRERWLDVDTIEDEYGTDAAFQIETVFDWLLEYEKDGNTCYEKFVRFYKDQGEKFTPAVKKLTLDTADAIADSFARKNKSELILLAKLKLLFQ
ncbi:MAG: hypothetical protein WBG90_05745 [Saonia sp.]